MNDAAQEVVDKPAPALVLGLGCERGTPPSEVIALAEEVLDAAGRGASERLRLIASLDTRSDEPAMIAAARHFSVPLRTFAAARLEAETPRLSEPSDIVFRHTGCHGVAEGAALAAAGPDGRLVVTKRRSAHATAAIVESFQAVVGAFSQGDSARSEIESSLGGAA
jgi:cobalt-precorrin 5A hydrolase